MADQAASLLGLLFNPFYLFEVSRQLVGEFVVATRALREPRPGQFAWVRLALPFVGRWTVGRGGVTQASSHSWALRAQRFAYDFLIVDDGTRGRTKRRRELADHPSWGQPLQAPITGEVVKVVDHWADHPAGARFRLPLTTRELAGNHLVIRQSVPPAFVLIAHLQCGSCIHRVGDTVLRGDFIGRCGNSGMSTEPHVHLQAQDRADLFASRSLPLAFERIVVERNGGRRHVRVGVLLGGDAVETDLAAIPMPATTDELPVLREPQPALGWLTALLQLLGLAVGMTTLYALLFMLMSALLSTSSWRI